MFGIWPINNSLDGSADTIYVGVSANEALWYVDMMQEYVVTRRFIWGPPDICKCLFIF